MMSEEIQCAREKGSAKGCTETHDVHVPPRGKVRPVEARLADAREPHKEDDLGLRVRVKLAVASREERRRAGRVERGCRHGRSRVSGSLGWRGGRGRREGRTGVVVRARVPALEGKVPWRGPVEKELFRGDEAQAAVEGELCAREVAGRAALVRNHPRRVESIVVVGALWSVSEWSPWRPAASPTKNDAL